MSASFVADFGTGIVPSNVSAHDDSVIEVDYTVSWGQTDQCPLHQTLEGDHSVIEGVVTLTVL